MSEAFIRRAVEAAKKSRIVVAFDPVFNPYLKTPDKRKDGREKTVDRIIETLAELEELVAGVKIGVPAIFALGLDSVESIIRSFEGRYLFICDSKMADIGHVNRLAGEQIFGAGFDALIVHAAVGRKDGIDQVVDLAAKMGKGVLGLCAMSHPGASEHLNRHVGELLAIAESSGVDGFVLPATFPELIRMARAKYPARLILSPGVGTQGAPFGSAVSAGADFEIIGRSITQDPHPARKAREIAEAMRGG
ncbi:MAG: orotidine 5'-phosphate decarboxylase / HUMPS family protein [Candidatus Hadarchaeales archaeon]